MRKEKSDVDCAFRNPLIDWNKGESMLTAGIDVGSITTKAALAEGLDWPHDCRVGSCVSCRCRLKEGKIKELSDFAYVLDGDQLKDGMILFDGEKEKLLHSTNDEIQRFISE